MSSSKSRRSFSCSTSKGSSSKSPSGKRDTCSFRLCSTCSSWHYACTGCVVRKGVKLGTIDQCRCHMYGLSNNRCRCKPRCVSYCERRNWSDLCPEYSLDDVTHEVKENYVEIGREDINNKSCYRGSVFNVCRAYIGDDNEKVSVKWVRSSHACGKDHNSIAIKEAKKSAELVLAFMNEVDTQNWKIKVLIPKKARAYFFYDYWSRAVLVEPYLKNFETFYECANDLDYLNGSTYSTVLKALIHFSIRRSRRQSMITNLQGSVDYKKKTIYLSGPVVKEDFLFSSGRTDISAFLRADKGSTTHRRC